MVGKVNGKMFKHTHTHTIDELVRAGCVEVDGWMDWIDE
jgi:hypothetical protein